MSECKLKLLQNDPGAMVPRSCQVCKFGHCHFGKEIADDTYRTKPMMVKAFQITRKTRASNETWPSWLHQAWNKELDEVGSLSPQDYPNSTGQDKLLLRVERGIIVVDWSDWLVKRTPGYITLVPDNVFPLYYEKI